METVLQDKIFVNLDSALNVESLLSLEDDFYQLFAKNSSKASHAWAAGGIDLESNHPYYKTNPGLYHTFHNKDFDFSFRTENTKSGQGSTTNSWCDELAVYLQLKYGAVDPYKFLHIVNHQENTKESKVCLQDWVFEFPQIVEWIMELPFSNFQNITLIFTPKFVQQGYHRDFNLYPIEKPETIQNDIPELDIDVVWCRFNLNRPFYLYDIDKNGKILQEIPLEGYTAMFNHYNWHGNINPAEDASLTIKLEGNLDKGFKENIKV